MKNELRYEDVAQYLRNFSTTAPSSQTFGDLLTLMLEAVENLRNNTAEGDILDFSHLITGEQAEFLQQLLQGRAKSTEVFVHEITHSSRVLHGVNESPLKPEK